MFSVFLGASLYATGRCLVSGAALESGMQHFVLTQKIMLRLVDFTVFFSPQIKLVGDLGGLVHGWW